jgi:hypothetical protein
MKVKKPNTILLFRFDLKSFKSSYKPAINIMYSKPMVENKSTAEFFSRTLNPCGPIKTPAIINPIILGIFIFLSKIGDKRMIKRINENIKTGLPNGNSNSCIR